MRNIIPLAGTILLHCIVLTHYKFQGVESTPKVLFCRKKRRQNNNFGADLTP
jgi:hypothetical protein